MLSLHFRRHREEKDRAKPRPRPMRTLRSRILRQLLLLTGFIVLSLSFLSILVSRSLIRNRMLEQLSFTTVAREDLLSRTLAYDQQRTSLLAETQDVRDGLSSPHSQSAVPTLWVELSQQKVPVLGITLFDAYGKANEEIGQASDDLPVPDGATIIRPAFDVHGRWVSTDVFAPVRGKDQSIIGTLAIRYDPSTVLTSMASNPSLGDSAELLILRRSGTGYSILFSSLGAKARQSSPHTPIVTADLLSAGIATYVGRDEWQDDVLAASRIIPPVGWTLAIKVDEREALSGWQSFTFTLLSLDVIFIALAALMGAVLAREVTKPVLELAEKMRAVHPGHWDFRRSVHSGDEIELLDAIAAELAGRLRGTYANLEREVSLRTQELHRRYILDRAILENIEYGVFVVDRKGRLVEANPMGLRLLQRRSDQVAGHKVIDAMPLVHTGATSPSDMHPAMRCLKEKRTVTIRQADLWSLKRADGTLLPVSLTVTPLREKRGLRGAIMIVQDVHEEQRIDEMKSDFIALASHQLRTPLSSLRWYLELIRGDDAKSLSREQKSYLSQVENSAKRMAGLLDDLLHVAHLEGGEIRTDNKQFDLGGLMRDLITEWKPLLDERGLRLILLFPKKAVQITSDPVLLHLVLQNLFTNAMKYSGHGKTIRIALVAKQHSVLIAVSDQGVGIPHEEQSHVFEKFFRAKNVRRSDTDGSGLGLYLTRAIVDNLGGHIAFKSAPGEGTTFTVKLPRR